MQYLRGDPVPGYRNATYNLPMPARLFRVILPVADIEQAARFYGHLFESEGERISPGRHYFECEGTILACYDAAADGDSHSRGPNPEHLYFAVDDLEAAYKDLTAKGFHFTIPPREVEDLRIAFFKGPDNITVELLQKMG